jgi:NAD(P)-dependent dehydrogenase (short-subunit alcohol dehydrogenase family)
MGTLEGKVAIVTGGGGGIGSATAKRMAAEGAKIVVADVVDEATREVVDAITAAGGTAIGTNVDVSQPDDVRAMVDLAVLTYGHLDVIHNNAAAGDVVGFDYDLVDVELAVWDRILAVNLTGPMLGCRFAIPRMLETGGGSIINTASVAGVFAEGEHVTYGVSKAGLILLTKHVAVRWGKQGIRCNAIAPGVVVTPRTRARKDDAWLAGMAYSHNSPRLGETDDIAQVVAFLASDASAFVNGSVLTADGGLTAKLRGLSDLSMDAAVPPGP